MNQKKRSKKGENASFSPPLPKGRILRENPLQEVYWQVRSGKVQGKSAIAFYFLLPRFQTEEGKELNAFLEETEEAFFSFLVKKAQKPHDTTRFAGLQGSLVPGVLTLSAAFSPFEERQYRTVGKCLISPEGVLQEIESL